MRTIGTQAAFHCGSFRKLQSHTRMESAAGFAGRIVLMQLGRLSSGLQGAEGCTGPIGAIMVSDRDVQAMLSRNGQASRLR